MLKRQARKGSFEAWRDPSLPPEKRAAELVSILMLPATQHALLAGTAELNKPLTVV